MSDVQHSMLDNNRKTSPSFIAFALTLVYTLGFFLWYSATPLGIVAMLDGKETMQMAESIHQQTLPAEPFYRAPFYSACLSLFRTVGFSQDWLLLLARLFNGICHLISTLLIYAIAQKLWKSSIAATTSSLLYGLNPVILYFAADPLDITLAITLLLAALWFTLITAEKDGLVKHACLAGLCIAFGTITRPHLLLVACIIPVLLFFIQPKKALASAASTALIILVFAFINLAISSQFKLLPTQGAYNLWAANKPGAHGKYLSQGIFIHDQEKHSNPTRLEARALYLKETNSTPPVSEDTINRYWRTKIIQKVLDDPLTWIRQMGLKAYYLLNNYEQYNNKTYSVHKSISPWLKYNPINWTLMLVLGLAGLLLSIRQRSTHIITSIALVYAIGVLLFFVSARFRLPLVPLLAIFSGGCVTALPSILATPKLKLAASITGLLGIGALSLSTWAQVDDPITIAEDFVLIAQANSELQNSNEAKLWAEQALVANPAHQAARELVCIAKYNILLDQLPALPTQELLQYDFVQCLHVSGFSVQARFIAGIYAHLLGNSTKAQQLWYTLVDQQSAQIQPALAALKFTNALRPQDEAIINSIPLTEMRSMLLISEIYAGNQEALQRLNNLLAPEEVQHHFEMINALFFRNQ